VSGLRAIVDEMADQIRAVLEAVDTIEVQVEPRYVLNPTPLTIDIYPGDVSRDSASAAFDDDGGYLLTVRSRINTPDFDAAYDILLSLMDDEDDLCLAQALLDDPTLNGLASDLDVRDPTGLRAYETPSGEGAHLGFQFTTIVLPARS
jgi:hypothetical protein